MCMLEGFHLEYEFCAVLHLVKCDFSVSLYVAFEVFLSELFCKF